MKRALPIFGLLGAQLACSHTRELPAKDTQNHASAAVPSTASHRAVPLLCPPPTGTEAPILFNEVPLLVLCHSVYADPATSPEERDLLKRWNSESLALLATVFGASKAEAPAVVLCMTDACALHFEGPTRRQRAFLEPRPMVVINGIGPLTKGTIVHEMVHVEIARRSGRQLQSSLPTWFNEGVATFVGDNVSCPAGAPRAIDDLRRLDAPHAWEGFADMAGKTQPFCQARAEIAAWAEHHGRSALVGVIDAVAAGRLFDDAYGPLVTSIPAESFDRSLDGSFSLDENSGANAVDQSGRSHIGTLMSGAIWTTGRHGAAVKVYGGSHVRADGFADFGVPDAPFSLSLWAKPLANAKILIHTAVQASGSNGWCAPVLGHDTSGHLVAQVPFGADSEAFLAATGPALPLNAWSHVVMMWSAADGIRLYVNGRLAASATPRSPAERHRDAPAAPMYLFFGSSNESRCWTHALEAGDWNGAIDELRVYNYALTSEQVAEDMRRR